MDKKPLIMVSICTVVLLVLGSSVPALAKTHFSLSKTIPLISTSSAEDYKVYIGAGFFREYEGKIGWGWHMTVENTGDTNITGAMYGNETTLSGKVVFNESGTFSLRPGCSSGWGLATLLDFPLITLINLTVVVENMTYSRFGYGIGPFVLLVD